MFTLKYKITNEDMKKINTRIMWMYFALYFSVSLLGLGAGIAATVLRPRTEMLVFGIILIVLGAILLGCSILLTIAPKAFVLGAVLPDDDAEREVAVGVDGITVRAESGSEVYFRMGEVLKVKERPAELLLYIGKDRVLILKDAITSGQAFAELVEFIKARTVKKNGVAEQGAPREEEPTSEAQADISSGDAEAEKTENE